MDLTSEITFEYAVQSESFSRLGGPDLELLLIARNEVNKNINEKFNDGETALMKASKNSAKTCYTQCIKPQE